MRSCLVLGTGRSGTSLVTGMLARAGYDIGGEGYLARAANPYGFFETPQVNGLNELLLAPTVPAHPALSSGQLWLANPAREVPKAVSAELATRMEAAVARRPFCLKDPRFSFTLPAWRPFLGDAGFVTVFRHPALTVASMLEEIRRAEYLQGVELDVEHLLGLWTATYRAILERHSSEGDWLFQHYDQAIGNDGRERLEAFTQATVDGGLAKPQLRRRRAEIDVPAEALELYRELCERADYEEPSGGPAPLAKVSVVALVLPGEQDDVPSLVDDVRDQRGVDAELVIVNASGSPLALEGATVVEATPHARGAAWLQGIDAASHETIALQRAGCRMLPARLAQALDALQQQDAQLVTCDYFLADEQGQFVGRSNPSLMDGIPGPGWESGLVARRSVLRTLDRTAFFPSELALYRTHSAAARTAHVIEPGFSVDRQHYADGWDRSRHDAVLVALADQPSVGEPELTVSLCTYDRPDVFLESLEGFCRQLVPRGAFEVVIVDDGDPGGSAADLEELELPIPCTYLRGPGRGLAAARNVGLARSRGTFVLFVNDDTIPAPDLVEQHLATHRRLGSPASVQGTFEQPAAALNNALLRHLERSSDVFGYADMKPGEWHDPFHFYTCNVSVPLALVHAVGAFDEGFRFYGCEDTDLGVRLDRAGCRVYYETRARARHHHPMDFDYLARRQHTVGRAYVHFFRKHPQLLEAWGNENVSAAWLEEQVASERDEIDKVAAAARELAGLDVGALDNLQGAYAEASEAVLVELAEWIPRLSTHWWRTGYLVALEEAGLAGFDELHRAREPWPLATSSTRAVLAWPCWADADDVDRVLELARPLGGAESFAALVLRFDPGGGVPREEALAALERAYERHFAAGEALEVVLEEADLSVEDLRRLGGTVQAFLTTGAEPEDVRRTVVAEPLDSPEAVAAWRTRYGPECAPSGRERAVAPTPEISVVVPTRDRPRELAQLLERLSGQDVDPTLFEVIVVDDGSRSPASASCRARSWPFALDVVRQEPSGPAAARNRGVERARGELVVFFNDDAVPAADCLRRHRDAQRGVLQSVAVLGSFRLLQRHLGHTFARWIESSTALFAQPEMQPGVSYEGLALCTGNVSLRRATLNEVGGFDEAFPWAGCEDSELGLRLERELGGRVLYEPTARCEHDHALDVLGFVQRRRVVGWGAWQVFLKHGDRSVLGLDARPEDPGWWRELEDTAAAEAGEWNKLADELADVSRRELRAGAVDPDALETLRPNFERLSEHAFHLGLLDARAGRRPGDAAVTVPSAPPAVRPTATPRAPHSVPGSTQ